MRVCTQKLDRKGGDSRVSGCTKLNYRVILFFVSNYGKQVWNLQKVISLRTIKDCRFEIIDLLHKTRLQISSEGTSRV